jgi:hypothetical protein
MRLRSFAGLSITALATAMLLPAGHDLQAYQTKKDKAGAPWRIVEAGEYKGGPAGPGVTQNVRLGEIPTGTCLFVIVEFKEDPGDVFTATGQGKGTLKNPVSTRFVLTSTSGKPLGNCMAYLRPTADGPGYRNLVFSWPQINDKKFVNAKDILLIDSNGYFAPVKVGAMAKPGPEKKEEVTKDKEKDPVKKGDPMPLTPEEKERLAGEKLQSAKLVLQDGNAALARLRLQSVIDDYPLSKAADEAKELLKKLAKK